MSQKNQLKDHHYSKNLWLIYDDLQRLIAFADRKATTLLTAHSIAIGFSLVLVSIGPINEAVFDPKADYWVLWLLGSLLSVGFGVLWVISLTNTLRVIKPRYGEINAPFTQFFFSRSIKKEFKSGEDYYENFRELDEHQINEGLSNQIYAIGEILNAKMDVLGKTIYLFCAFIALLVLSSIVFLVYHELAL